MMKSMLLPLLLLALSCSAPSEPTPQKTTPAEPTKTLAAMKLPTPPAQTTPASAPTPVSAPASLPSFLQPGPIKHEVTVSARWKASIGGMVNLKHPTVIKAGLKDASIPIVLPAHVLIHPKAGLYMIDSGITKKSGYGFITAVDPVLDILGRHQEPFAGVLLTHSHYDHVMGIPELPKKSVIHAGPGELSKVTTTGLTVRFWDFKDAVQIGGMPAIDIVGDGSLWALWVPGHTKGSTAYLANTTQGPMLFTGDTCHAIWGWENGVGNGSYSSNKVKNQASLDLLRALVKEYPQIKVYTGHEIDGEGTGVDEAGKK